MKITHEIAGGAARVEIRGELEAGRCDCLRAYWSKHLAGELATVDVRLAEVDGVDGESVATLVDLIRGHLGAAAEVTLHDPPQMLAHTLYKIGLLDHAALTLVNPRSDEQGYG